MIKVGLTGGIGSGKSIIGKTLMIMGFPVFNSDNEAKFLMVKNQKVVDQIKKIFGEEAYSKGQLNRKFLAGKIFNDPILKDQLNKIVHPAVRQVFRDWCKNQTAPIIFNEAAILFETGRYKDFDFNILVTAPEAIRIQRVIDRDNTSIKDVRKRMENQWGDDKKKELASFVITNDDQALVTKQIEQILAALKASILSL